jgi:micrococcal nuclease
VNVSRIVGGALVVIATLPAGAFAQTVTKVSSGDTVVISGVGKIRLLGIHSDDGPAARFGRGTVPPAQPRTDASTPPTPAVSGAIGFKRERPSRLFLQQLVLGKKVKLQFDSLAEGKGVQRAYLFLDDGRLVNAEMLRVGRARVDLSRPFAHQVEFKRIEDEARAAGVGIWTQVADRR